MHIRNYFCFQLYTSVVLLLEVRKGGYYYRRCNSPGIKRSSLVSSG